MQREARSCVRKGRDAVEMQRDRQTGLPLKRVRSVLGGVEPAPSSVSALRRCPVKRRRRVLKPFRREEGSSRAVDPPEAIDTRCWGQTGRCPGSSDQGWGTQARRFLWGL